MQAIDDGCEDYTDDNTGDDKGMVMMRCMVRITKKEWKG